MRFTRHETYQTIETGKTYATPKRRLFVRSTSDCHVWWTKGKGKKPVLAGKGTVFEVEMAKGFFSIVSEGEVYVSDNLINQQMLKVHDEVFTSLDRPSPMSPEMLAIARMERQNELQREEYTRRLINAENNARAAAERLRRADNVDVDEAPATEKKAKPKPAGGKKKVSRRKAEDDDAASNLSDDDGKNEQPDGSVQDD